MKANELKETLLNKYPNKENFEAAVESVIERLRN